MNGFKNLAAASIAANFEIKQVTALKEAVAKEAATPTLNPADIKKQASDAKAKKEEEEAAAAEAEDGLDGGFDMFGGDEY